jgi:hypothetical protein
MKYTIKKGNHKGFTLRRFFPFRWSKFKRKKLVWEIRIHNVYNTQGDRDLRFDWSKLFGVNLTAFKPSNVNSIMNSFRSADTHYEQSLFRNNNGDQIYDNDELVIISTEEYNRGELEYLGNNRYRFSLKPYGEASPIKIFEFEESRRGWLCRYIFPWHGGKDDDGNNLGGPAPEDIHFTIDFKWIKK